MYLSIRTKQLAGVAPTSVYHTVKVDANNLHSVCIYDDDTQISLRSNAQTPVFFGVFFSQSLVHVNR
jgi:hypothetical protein